VQLGHGVRKPRKIDHPERTVVVPDAQLLDTFAYGGHRLEVVRLQATLNLVELVTRIVPRRLAELA
jgi:hypothetical protein